MKYLLSLFACAVLFSSCEDFFSQTIEIDPPEYDKNMSFHLNLGTLDSTIEITVLRNFGILENVNNDQDWLVKGASAELFENGLKWLTLHPLNNDSSHILLGKLPHHFQAGSTYEIRITHPDFPTLSAVQTVPNDFQVDSVRVRYDAVIGESGEVLNLLEVYLKDAPNERNFYEVSLLNRVFAIGYNPATGLYDTSGIREYTLYVDGYPDPNVESGFDDTGLISDQFFDGQAYKFQARYNGRSSDLIDSLVTVRIRNITKEHLNWTVSYLRKLNDEGNPLAEPIPVYNNLENGLGIFTISNEKRYLVRKNP
jgi:hypothetical protein